MYLNIPTIDLQKEGVRMQNERTERRREFIINALYFAAVALIAYFGIRYAVKWLMPFIIGFVIAFTAKPAVLGLCKVTRMNRKLAGILVLLLEYAVIVLIIWILGSKIFVSIRDLFTKMPEYYDSNILPFFNSLAITAEAWASKISPETLEQIYSMVENASDSIRSYILRLSSDIVSGIAGVTTKIPFYFISFAFTILASIFISMDYKSITDFVKKQLPLKSRAFLSDAKKHIGKTVLGYLRAYLIIWVMTFTELSIGLSILKIENAIGIAALIAVADILPVVGTGGILIPWAAVALFTQNYFVAVGLIVLYVIVLVVRNFAEPKIVGDQLGLNPLVTLIAIYLGYRLLGFGGMIILPVATNILVGLQRAGKIKLWME